MLRLARMRCNVNLGQAEIDWQCTDCGILDEDLTIMFMIIVTIAVTTSVYD